MKAVFKLVVPVAVVAVSGCAIPPLDYSALESTVNEASAGDFGQCYQSVHAAAIALKKAQMALEEAKRDELGNNAYSLALADANMAAEQRRMAEEACNARTAVLEADMEIVKGVLADHEARLDELEKVREIVRGVTFADGSARLTQQARTVLDVVANRLIRAPIQVQIAGHTSSTGTPDGNMKLSIARAEAVKRYLISVGVDGSNLTARGYGQNEPIASNGTAQGREANRRVELRYNE